MIDNKILKGIIRYIRRTWKNKLIALALLAIGGLTLSISNDATVFIFMMFITLPLFFINKNVIK